MKQIKFSHKYYKLPMNVGTATLLQVLTINKEDLSPEFVEYDTSYPANGKYSEEGTPDKHYPLPNGKLLLLILQTGWIWTTIRRWTPEKERYYRGSIGETFNIAIEEASE
jgi:hypothetical protein